DDDVRQAVAVDVAEADAAGRVVARVRVLPLELGVRLRDFAKAAAAVVDEEPVAAVAAGQEDVGPAVAVHVGDRHAEAGGLVGQAAARGPNLDAEPAKVPDQRRAALAPRKEALPEEEIEQAVAVVVEDRHAAGGEFARAGARAGGDVNELAAAVVAEKE